VSITNYTSLRDAIAGSSSTSWSHRNDLLGVFDTFLQLVEERIYKGGEKTGGEFVDGLRIRALETRSTATLSTSSRFLALPDNFLQARRAELEYGNAIYPLEFVTAPDLLESTSAGRPCRFTVTSQYEFDRTPDVAYTIEVQHYAKQTAISSSNATNDILTNFPSIYLYGCMAEVYKWTQNVEKAAQFNDLFLNSIKEANTQDKWGRVGPTPSMTNRESIV